MPAETPTKKGAILFVSNFSDAANAQYLERLFSAYGKVVSVDVRGSEHERLALVTYESPDDADAAVAALHYRYFTAKDLPLIVLYHKSSPCITAYGRAVGREFKSALTNSRTPEYLELKEFDESYDRTLVLTPPAES